MFDEPPPKAKTAQFPRDLENMSVSNLEEYTTDLNAEIQRVQSDITNKKASQNAAASVFKF